MKHHLQTALLLLATLLLLNVSLSRGKKLSKRLQKTLEETEAKNAEVRKKTAQREEAKMRLNAEIEERFNAPLAPGFYVGRMAPGLFEYNDLNGRMTLKSAVDLCENDLQCGGFTYNGPDLTSEGVLMSGVTFDVFFYRTVERLILKNEVDLVDLAWTTYKVERPFVLVRGRPFYAIWAEANPAFSQFRRNFEENNLEDAIWPGKNATSVSYNLSDSSADVGLRTYLDLADFDFSSTSEWVTLVNTQGRGLKSLLDQRRQVILGNCPYVDKVGEFVQEMLPERVEVSSECEKMEEANFKELVVARKVFKLHNCWHGKGGKDKDDKSSSARDLLKRMMKVGEGGKISLDYSLNQGRSVVKHQDFNFEKIDKLLSGMSARIRISDLGTSLEKFRFLPDDLRAKLGSGKDGEPEINATQSLSASFESADVGESLTEGDRDTFRVLAAGTRLWVIIPAPGSLTATKCRTLGEGTSAFSSAAAWLDTMFPQLVRERFRGRRPLLVRQEAGEAVYIPAEYVRVSVCLEDCVDLRHDFLTEASILRRGLYEEAKILRQRLKKVSETVESVAELTNNEFKVLELLEAQMKEGRVKMTKERR